MTDKKLLTEWRPFEYTKDMIEESKRVNNGKIIMRGVLQKSDTLNQNGRIYPRPILEREVRNYQKFIKENRALGECVPPGTQIYTHDGWKNIESISEDEMIYTLNIQKNELELQRISRKVVLPFAGQMIRIKNSSSIDMCLTPSHKMLLWNRNNESYTITAQEFYDKWESKDSHVSHSSIKRAGAAWVGENPEKFTLLSPRYEIDTRLWAAFLGIYLAEGCSSGVNNPDRIRNRIVQITQANSEVKTAIENLLSKLPFDYEIRTRADDLTNDYFIKCEVLHSHLLQLGNSRNKFVPNYAKQWSAELQGIMLEWMLLGDGRHRTGRDGSLIPEYCTTSKRLATDVEEIMLKLGTGATITVWDRSADRQSPETGRMILGENCADMNIVYQRSSKGSSMDFRFLQVEKVDYDGDVFCVTVPNGTWLMKYNGKTCWTHNCDHPESSVVELKNASHIVREAYMEGDVCMGTVELLDTPSGKILQSLVESGVTLGISSRGVGSTRRDGDYDVVQDDFQLICWDYVSEPSTPGAFMMREGKEISERDLRKHFKRSDRVDRIFNDILNWKKD